MSKKFQKKFPSLFLILASALLFLFSPGIAKAAFCNCAIWDVGCWLMCVVGWIVSMPIRTAFFMVLLPITLTALLFAALLTLFIVGTQWLFAIAVNIGVTPNNPSTIQLVEIGWTFTRDFANMFFVLALLMIGLATILKLQDYQAKKALPRLIMIALLINFTPVIVGFVVDIANIMTKFFIDKAGSLNFDPIGMALDLFPKLVSIFTVDGDFLTRFVEVALPPILSIGLSSVVLLFFFGYGIYVYFLIMTVFFLRIVWLWLLMILSPIAFLSYVFPQNDMAKNFFPSVLNWDEWWKELVKWAVVGIPLGFFIYLASWIMVNTDAVSGVFLAETLESVLGGITTGDASLDDAIEEMIAAVTNVIAPLIGIVILHQGYKITKEVGPSAASGLIKGVEKIGQQAKGAALMAASYGAGALAGGAKRTGIRAGTIAREHVGERVGSAAKLGAGRVAGWAGRRLSKVPGLRRASKGLMAREEKAREEYAEMKRELPPEFDKMRKENKQAWLKGANKSQLVMAASKDKEALSVIQEDERLKDKLIEAAKSKASKPPYKSAIKNLQQQLPEELGGFEVGLKLAFDKERFKKGIDQIIEDCDELNEGDRDMATRISILKGARKKDIKEMSTGILKSRAARITSKNYWRSSNVLAVHEKLDKESWKNFFEGEGGINNVKAEDLLEKNPSLARSFHFNRSMRALGYKDMKGLKKKIEDEGPPDSSQTTLDDYS